MNWWLGLALVLPMILSYKAMEVLLPRFILLGAFLLVFLLYFFGIRTANFRLPARALTQVLLGCRWRFC